MIITNEHNWIKSVTSYFELVIIENNLIMQSTEWA